MEEGIVLSDTYIHIYPIEPSESDGWLRIGARIEGLANCPDTLWFDLEPEHADCRTQVADPFVLAMLFPAMQSGSNLFVHGQVSRKLLANLEYFQAVWHNWMPFRYSSVRIEADLEVQAGAVGDSTLSMFSGGLDSCFSIYRHHRGLVGRRNLRIDACLMVHGLDIPVDEADQFLEAAENSRQILDSISTPLWRMRTNFRSLPADWEHSHGTGLAACLHCYAGRFRRGVIASTQSTNSLDFPWGSHVFTDPLLSCDRFEIINDGSETARLYKPRLVADWPEAMRRLRVCWQSERRAHNCGRCRKCLLTKIAFMANGLPLPLSLEPEPSSEQLHRIWFGAAWEATHVRLSLELAELNGLKATAWFKALESCLAWNSARFQKASRHLAIRRWAEGMRQFLSRGRVWTNR